MSKPVKQVHLAAHFPGVNNTTVWSDPRAGSHIEFSSFAHFAATAERARFDFLFLAEGLRLREQKGEIYDLDVVGRPDTFTILAALAAVTDRLGLAGTINSTFNEPYEVARQFASLDHLSEGRAAWNVVTSWDAFTGENFRRGGFLPREQRYERARTFLHTTWELLDSWRGDEIVADKASGEFLAHPDAADSATPTRTSTSPGSSTFRAAHRAGRSSSRPATPTRAASLPRPTPTPSSAGTPRCRQGRRSTPTSRAGWPGTAGHTTSC
jgi:alkanesulfonate monooxygenase SsuD/methylene tetrahydromethanopterin reductase-like flavin-dependent oxidoreductase (luciferase family)